MTTTNAEVVKKTVRAQGFALPPAGRRLLWAVLVPRCPWCNAVHLHRSTGPHGGIRVGSCGRAYVVQVAGMKRGRWLA